MITPKQISVDSLGDKKKVIPGPEPKIKKLDLSKIGSEQFTGYIPVCEPDLRGKEKEYLLSCVEDNWISSAGQYVNEFEKKFSQFSGCEYGVSCTSGTTALHLALVTLGIGTGDEVIIPTFTMIATANTVRYTGAVPVLVDLDNRCWNMDVNQIEEKITNRTKAIVVVHTYGHPAEMYTINKIAKKYNLYVVEDAAEAHGAKYKGQSIGSIGDVACFSFYGNKIITTGEGGMLVTNNKEIATIAANLRDHAFSKDRHFWHKYVGFNYRMTNMQAAVGLAQVERIEEMVEIRRQNASIYTHKLSNIPSVSTPFERCSVKNVFWMYGILVNGESESIRDELRIFLADSGIETRSFFIPIHLQPVYYEQFSDQNFPNSEYLCQYGLYLPSSSTLTEKEITYITDKIKRFFEGASKQNS